MSHELAPQDRPTATQTTPAAPLARQPTPVPSTPLQPRPTVDAVAAAVRRDACHDPVAYLLRSDTQQHGE